MPKNREVPGVGVVAFPDTMSEESIAAAIAEHAPTATEKSERTPLGVGLRAGGAVAGLNALVRTPAILRALAEGGPGGWLGQVARGTQAYLWQKPSGGPEMQPTPQATPAPQVAPRPRPAPIPEHLHELTPEEQARIPNYQNRPQGTVVPTSNFNEAVADLEAGRANAFTPAVPEAARPAASSPDKYVRAAHEAYKPGKKPKEPAPRKGAKPGARAYAEPSASNVRSVEKLQARQGARPGARPMEPRVPITIHEGEGATTTASRGASQRGRTGPQLDRIAAERARLNPQAVDVAGAIIEDIGPPPQEARAIADWASRARSWIQRVPPSMREEVAAMVGSTSPALEGFGRAAKVVGPFLKYAGPAAAVGTAALGLPGVVEAAQRGDVAETAGRGFDIASPISRDQIIYLADYLNRRLHPLGQDY